MLLLEVAERLFAESGVESVTLNRIVEESGQRNRSALNYHFGSRADIVTQLLIMRLSHVNQIRHRYLDRLEQRGQGGDVHAILTAAIRPLGEVIRHEPWGRHYVKILAQTMLSPALRSPDIIDPTVTSAIARTNRLIAAALPHVPRSVMQMRLNYLQETVIFSIVRALQQEGREYLSDKALNNLIDFCTAGVMGVVSAACKNA